MFQVLCYCARLQGHQTVLLCLTPATREPLRLTAECQNGLNNLQKTGIRLGSCFRAV